MKHLTLSLRYNITIIHQSNFTIMEYTFTPSKPVRVFDEMKTVWLSHKHPDNPNFMQVVRWVLREKPDGQVIAQYNLGANGPWHKIFNLTKSEILARFVDEPEPEITDAMFEQWKKDNGYA